MSATHALFDGLNAVMAIPRWYREIRVAVWPWARDIARLAEDGLAQGARKDSRMHWRCFCSALIEIRSWLLQGSRLARRTAFQGGATHDRQAGTGPLCREGAASHAALNRRCGKVVVGVAIRDAVF